MNEYILKSDLEKYMVEGQEKWEEGEGFMYGSEIKDLPTHTLPPKGEYIRKDDYNSGGPWMFRSVIQMRKWKDKILNVPPEIFYPIPDSYLVPHIYDGSFNIPDSSFALHWYGGHPKSQEFNKKYTEEFAETSDDTISKFLREKEII